MSQILNKHDSPDHDRLKAEICTGVRLCHNDIYNVCVVIIKLVKIRDFHFRYTYLDYV
jgi:hypothetical protein